MELDARLILTIAGMGISVVSTFAIMKQKLVQVFDQLGDIERRLRVIDQRVDKTELTGQRVDVLSGMMSPAEREKSAREVESIGVRLSQALARIDHLEHIHNSRHPRIDP